MKTYVLCAVVGFMLVMPSLVAQANASGSVDQLQQLTAQLQQSPGDQALREKIINLAQELKQAPTLPDEAERRMVRGIAAFKAAQSVADYKDAVAEFTQATLAAPWYGDAYYNLGVAQDKAEQYDAALRSLKLALLASPGSKDIKDFTYKVEYRAEQANTPEGKAETEYGPAQQQFAALIQKFDGAVFVQDEIYNGSLHFFRDLHFYKSGRYHLLMCDKRERYDDLNPFPGQDGHHGWENKYVGDYILPTNGRDKNAGGFVLFHPDSGQEFAIGCRGAFRISADGTTIDQINLYSSTGEVMSVWHRQ